MSVSVCLIVTIVVKVFVWLLSYQYTIICRNVSKPKQNNNYSVSIITGLLHFHLANLQTQ